ncbi:MAG: hypothetical protein K2G24_00500 [Muribaculaceae bacterium]|nr:hypothetical protein [Muribaculaceae bacterium]
MDHKLKYRDEQDKTYGLTGMAIALVMADGEDMLVQMSLDAPAGEGMRFSPDFYFRGNPRYSAKLAWNQMLKQISLLTGMLMGNVMCRSYLIDRSRLSDEVIDRIKAIIRSEAVEECSLDNDEVDNLFRSNFNYFDRIFNHQAVASIARSFALELQSRRTLSGKEILDNLRDLARI